MREGPGSLARLLPVTTVPGSELRRCRGGRRADPVAADTASAAASRAAAAAAAACSRAAVSCARAASACARFRSCASACS
jgi:hypothetical protein